MKEMIQRRIVIESLNLELSFVDRWCNCCITLVVMK